MTGTSGEEEGTAGKFSLLLYIPFRATVSPQNSREPK